METEQKSGRNKSNRTDERAWTQSEPCKSNYLSTPVTKSTRPVKIFAVMNPENKHEMLSVTCSKLLNMKEHIARIA